MIRFWFPLLIAYARNEAREQAEWDSVCDQIAARAAHPRRRQSHD